MDPAARRKLEFDRGALTASGRSVTIAAMADSQREKKAPVKSTSNSVAVGSASADTNAGITYVKDHSKVIRTKLTLSFPQKEDEHD